MGFVGKTVESCQYKPVDGVQSIRVLVGWLRSKTQFRAKIEQDVWRLIDDKVAVLEHRRGQVGWIGVVSHVRRVYTRQNLLWLLLGSINPLSRVRVIGTGLLEGEPDMLTAAGDSGPIDQLVRGILG